jgi:hypothetical protein
MTLEKRVTVGELLLIIGLIISTITFFFKTGNWVGKIDTQFERLKEQVVEIKVEQGKEVDKIQNIDERLSRVEGTTKRIEKQTK